MEDNQYKIISKEIKGISLVGVTIENDTGNRKNINITDATKLARGNKLSNASAKLDVLNGEYKLDIDGGLQSIEYSDRTKGLHLTLLGRLLNTDNKCVGYKAQDDKGKIYKLSISKIWELAEQGSVKGIKAKVTSGYRVLISTKECKLQSLPIFKS